MKDHTSFQRPAVPEIPNRPQKEPACSACGLLGYVIFNEDLDQGALQASGIIGSVIGAIVALVVA